MGLESEVLNVELGGLLLVLSPDIWVCVHGIRVRGLKYVLNQRCHSSS